jgi:hypothetical protein
MTNLNAPVHSGATMPRRWRLAFGAATIAVALVGIACLGHSRRALSGTFDESNHTPVAIAGSAIRLYHVD